MLLRRCQEGGIHLAARSSISDMVIVPALSHKHSLGEPVLTYNELCFLAKPRRRDNFSVCLLCQRVNVTLILTRHYWCSGLSRGLCGACQRYYWQNNVYMCGLVYYEASGVKKNYRFLMNWLKLIGMHNSPGSCCFFVFFLSLVLALKVAPTSGRASILGKWSKTETLPVTIDLRSFVFETHLLFKTQIAITAWCYLFEAVWGKKKPISSLTSESDTSNFHQSFQKLRSTQTFL